MIQIKGTNLDNLECYLFSIQNKQFLFWSKPNLEFLKYFTGGNRSRCEKVQKNEELKNNLMVNQSTICNQPQIKYQQLSGQKTQSKRTKQNPSSIKIHFNLTYLKQCFRQLDKKVDKTTIYLMITDYQQFLVAPYLIRRYKDKHEIKLFCTHIVSQIGRIYMKQFFNKITQFDLLHTQTIPTSYQQQSTIQDQFYIKFNLQIKDMTKLFTFTQMQQTFKLTNKMNYGQIHQADGVNFTPFPAGYSFGSAIWMFENTLTKQNIIFIKSISNQTWRSFSQNYLLSEQKQNQKFRQKNINKIDLIIIANNHIISTNNDKNDVEIIKLMKNIMSNLEKNINTEIIFDDELLVLDIIEYINFEMKGKFMGVFIENQNFNQIISYANSYVQFLSAQYKDKIYKDPPQYPFQGCLMLRSQGLLSTGNMFDISDKKKLPLRQLLSRSTPYISFRASYSAYLQGINETQAIWYKQRGFISRSDLSKILNTLNPKKIISYANIFSQVDQVYQDKIGILQYGKHFQIQSQSHHYYQSKNISSNIINKYEFVDGYIMAYPLGSEFLKLNSGWNLQLQKHLKESYRPVLQIRENLLRTAMSEVWVENYELFIKSKDVNEALFITQILTKITKTIKLK